MANVVTIHFSWYNKLVINEGLSQYSPYQLDDKDDKIINVFSDLPNIVLKGILFY